MIDWNAIAMLKFVSITDADSLTRQELKDLEEADKAINFAKLSDRNLIKPGPIVSHKRLRQLK